MRSCICLLILTFTFNWISVARSAVFRKHAQPSLGILPPSKRYFSPPAQTVKRANMRGGFQQMVHIKDCLQVSKDTEGFFSYEHIQGEEVCGLYLVGGPDQRVKLTLVDAAIGSDCEEEVIVFLDGWELNGNILPSVNDHLLPLADRVAEFCGPNRPPIQLVSTQNNAMVQYKIKKPGHRFLVSVEYIPNPDPCNVLMSETTGVFTFSNEGRARNCSITTLMFPAKFEVLGLSIGAKVTKRKDEREGEVGISSQCSHHGERDFLELGGSSYLSSSRLGTREAICGYQPQPLTKALIILCDSSTVRLVSSGDYKNSVTVLVRAANEDDLENQNDVQMVCPDF